MPRRPTEIKLESLIELPNQGVCVVKPLTFEGRSYGLIHHPWLSRPDHDDNVVGPPCLHEIESVQRRVITDKRLVSQDMGTNWPPLPDFRFVFRSC